MQWASEQTFQSGFQEPSLFNKKTKDKSILIIWLAATQWHFGMQMMTQMIMYF